MKDCLRLQMTHYYAILKIITLGQLPELINRHTVNLNFFLQPTVRYTMAVEIYPYSVLTLALDTVSCQGHAPAAFLWEEPRNQSGVMTERDNFALEVISKMKPEE
jgi:hypothetical protein